MAVIGCPFGLIAFAFGVTLVLRGISQRWNPAKATETPKEVPQTAEIEELSLAGAVARAAVAAMLILPVVTVILMTEMTLRLNHIHLVQAPFSTTGQLLALASGIGTSIPVLWESSIKVHGAWKGFQAKPQEEKHAPKDAPSEQEGLLHDQQQVLEVRL